MGTVTWIEAVTLGLSILAIVLSVGTAYAEFLHRPNRVWVKPIIGSVANPSSTDGFHFAICLSNTGVKPNIVMKLQLVVSKHERLTPGKIYKPKDFTTVVIQPGEMRLDHVTVPVSAIDFDGQQTGSAYVGMEVEVLLPSGRQTYGRFFVARIEAIQDSDNDPIKNRRSMGLAVGHGPIDLMKPRKSKLFRE